MWRDYIDEFEGFSYRGKRITDFGLNYAPSAADIGTFTGEYRVEAETPEVMNGGYWFGTMIEPRVFSLNCVYEDMPDSIMFDVLRWFDRRKDGELIFGNRPYAVYKVRPTKEIVFGDYPHRDYKGNLIHSGTCTIELTAYSPFAKVAVPYIPNDVIADDTDFAEALVAHELMVLPESKMPATPTTSSTSFLMYNCGSEPANTVLNVAGNGTITFTNEETGQTCVVKPTTAATTSASKWLELNSRNGTCYLADSSSKTLKYDMHDYGYITIAPCNQYERNIEVMTTASSATITCDAGKFADWMVGKYIYLEGAWHKITAVSSATQATIEDTMSNTAVVVTDVVAMNKINITGTSITITKIEMTCTPRVR